MYHRQMTGSEVSGDTREAIVRATYRALCANGYADTTISAIAAEFEKSKSLLYYHYDGKDDLLEEFLRFVLDQLESELAATDATDAEGQLWSVVNQLLPPEPDAEAMRLRRALVEARANAPHSATYHDRFEESDEVILNRLAAAVDRGVETGAFRAVDPEPTAEFVCSTAYGAIERAVTLEDRRPIHEARTGLERYVDDCLRAEE